MRTAFISKEQAPLAHMSQCEKDNLSKLTIFFAAMLQIALSVH
jgi:hypothetical protein